MVYLSQKVLLRVVVVATCILLNFGIPCEHECCYWYEQFPATPSACDNTNGTVEAPLFYCQVRSRLDVNFTNVEVKWYRSIIEDNAGIEGERITKRSGKYTMLLLTRNEVFLQYALLISNFNINEDGGYYWCQIVVDNMPLSPSPYGHINSHPCTNLLACTLDQPLCAHTSNSTAQLRANALSTGTNCTLLDTDTMILNTDSISECRNCSLQDNNTFASNTGLPMATMILNTDSTVTDKCNLSMSGYLCTFGIITGIILLVIVSLLVLVTLLLFNKNRKTRVQSTSNKFDSTTNHYDKFVVDECNEAQEVSNPHYSPVTAHDNMKPEDDDCKMTFPPCTRVEHTDSQKYTVPNMSYLNVALPKNANSATRDGTSTASMTNPSERLNVQTHEFGNPTRQQTSSLYNENMKFEEEITTAKKGSVQVLSQSSTDHKLETTTHESLFPEYAIVMKSKKEAKQKQDAERSSSTAKIRQPSGYDKCMKQQESSKATTTIKEHPASETHKRSPTHEYAEVATKGRKQESPNTTVSVEKHTEDPSIERTEPTLDHEYAEVAKEGRRREPTMDTVLIEKQKDLATEGAREKSPSPEYAEVAKATETSTKSTNQENEGSEQHYYHSLENPEQLCFDDNKEKEESMEKGELKCSFPQPPHVAGDDINCYSELADDGPKDAAISLKEATAS